MFSGTGKRQGQRKFKADLKFSLIFGVVFWITAIILYAFVFIYIYSSLRDDARSGIQVRMLGYWAIVQSDGLESLKQNVDVNMILSGEQPFFVRIADEFNNTVLLEIPANWNSFNFKKLENETPKPGSFTVLRSPLMKYILETGCIALSDGHYLQVGISDENRRRIMELLYSSFTVALLVLVAVSLIAGFFVSYRFLLPVRDLEKAVREVIETGRIESRIIERKGAGELDLLVVSFNNMLQKIEELVRGMKGALDTVAHDLRTPLTRFRMVSEKALTRDDFKTDSEAISEFRSALGQAVEESDTVLRMMNLLMDISEAETGTLRLSKTEFNPVDRIREIIDVYEYAAEDRNISIKLKQPVWNGTLTADEDRFRQAVGNLIDNAVKYGRDGGSVNIELSADDDFVCVTVIDDGEGIADADLPEIWKRLYRGKSSRDGLGLGLSLVNAIIKAHGGTAEVKSVAGQGSVFTIRFPGE